MNSELEKIYRGILPEEEEDLNLLQICHFCEMSKEAVIELVEEGIVEPTGGSKVEWRFSFTTVERVKKINRLRKDFELTLAGVGLAMQLLDRIEELERTLERIRGQSLL